MGTASASSISAQHTECTEQSGLTVKNHTCARSCARYSVSTMVILSFGFSNLDETGIPRHPSVHQPRMAFTRVAVVPLKHGANRLVELDAAAFVDTANIKLRKFHSIT
jgi:hypothetical protein